MGSLRLGSFAALALLPALCLTTAGRASAAITIVTPGEQNTYSGENSCDPNCDATLHSGCNKTCDTGHWLHYPELVAQALGAGYTVQNDGDGGSIIGCDATQTGASGGSFCKNALYAKSTSPAPNIAIIGPFGEHDQRALKTNMTLNTQPAFEAAYEALVQDYLKLGATVYIMTPIDSQPWGGTDALPNNEDLVKTIMVPAALAVAAKHSITVIDSYTAITGTQALQTMYYKTDGQVNSDAQKKMADLIVAAIKGGGSGGAGGAGGAGGSGGTAGGAGAGAGGTSGGSGGTAGAATGTAGAATGTAGAATGTAGAATGTAGAATGTAGAATGTAGAATGTAGAASTPSSGSSDDSGGCSVAAVGGNGWNAGILLGLAGLLGLSRRRRQRN